MGIDASTLEIRGDAVRHIDSRPPPDRSLDAYANAFPDALAEAFPDNPDVHELVWIEHVLQAALVARDSACDPMADWAQVDWERVRNAMEGRVKRSGSI